MWQTQIGLPEAVRDHPERWPFVIVMPQCPQGHFWTDPGSQELAMAALDRETAEFHGDPERTYLTGLSLGGYGAWELARLYPHRWAAVAIAAGGIFWSYAPERWKQSSTLPAEYAHALGRTPVWLFHGTDDPVVAPRQSELMYEAFKAAGRPHPAVALPGPETRLLDPRLQRAGAAALAAGAPSRNCAAGKVRPPSRKRAGAACPGRAACHSAAPARHPAYPGADRQPGWRIP